MFVVTLMEWNYRTEAAKITQMRRPVAFYILCFSPWSTFPHKNSSDILYT